MQPDDLFTLLDRYEFEGTLMQRAAIKPLDRIDGWQKVDSDDIATVRATT